VHFVSLQVLSKPRNLLGARAHCPHSRLAHSTKFTVLVYSFVPLRSQLPSSSPPARLWERFLFTRRLGLMRIKSFLTLALPRLFVENGGHPPFIPRPPPSESAFPPFSVCVFAGCFKDSWVRLKDLFREETSFVTLPPCPDVPPP